MLDALRDRTMADPNSGCWLWTGSLTKGYGMLKGKYAHRLALELSIGRALLPGEMACHKCDVPACINPDHLYAGTAKTNSRDMFDRGRASRKGEANGRSKLTLEQAAEIRAVLANPISDGRQRRVRGTITALAKKYGVFRSTIHKIAVGEVWATC